MTTLDSLVAELGVRLGFATQGGAVAAQREILRSFIREAQSFLYWHMDDEAWFRVKQMDADGLGQSLFNLPTDLEVGKRFEIRWRKAASARWCKLARDALFQDDREEESYTPYAQSMDARVSGSPQVYRVIGQQVEIFPATEDRLGQIRFEYVKALPPLVKDADLLMVRAEPVLMLALANAKAHYQHPDAGQYATMFERLMKQMRSSAHVDKRYLAGVR